jgi:Sugar (and other) transporter
VLFCQASGAIEGATLSGVQGLLSVRPAGLGPLSPPAAAWHQHRDVLPALPPLSWSLSVCHPEAVLCPSAVLELFSVRPAGLGLQVLQQLCGINTVMYFTPAILELAGFQDKRTALLMAMLPAGVNATGTVAGMW